MKVDRSPLPHFDRRPPGLKVDTIVIHSLYAPEAPDPFAVKACLAALDQNRVAAHYLISRRGKITQMVEENRRAWHAGVSTMPFAPHDVRENVNHFSIGIELIGMPAGVFTDSQYEALLSLVVDICSRHLITSIVGHDAIAPGRKVDPGSAFDWKMFGDKLAKLLKAKKIKAPRLSGSRSS